MAAYSYKEVVYRDDFQDQKREWEKINGDSDGDANYAGDYWLITSELLDSKDAEISALRTQVAALKDEVKQSRAEGRADVAVQLRKIVDPTDSQHWSIDGTLKYVQSLCDAFPGSRP